MSEQTTSSTSPSWFGEVMEPTRINHARLDPYPFSHPANLNDYICLQQNDYLRLSARPEVLQAKLDTIQCVGNGALAATVYGGDGGNSEHGKLRRELSKAMRCDDVLLTCSGWTANVGLVEALSGPGRVIYLDQKAHASLWDGARMSGARSIMVRHNDPEALERRIRRDGSGVVCIDSWYSTDGSVADVKAYVEICERHDCLLVLDEAHSFGMTGANAGGVAVAEGIAERVHFRTTSFSKGLGGHGGCIATSAQMAWYLTHRSRTIIFSSSALPCDSAAHLAALQVLQREPWLAQNALAMAERFRNQLHAHDIDTGNSACQIVSIAFDTDGKACQAYGLLRERGILASVFVAPAVPEKSGLLRFSIHGLLDSETVDHVAEQVAEVCGQLHLGHISSMAA